MATTTKTYNNNNNWRAPYGVTSGVVVKGIGGGGAGANANANPKYGGGGGGGAEAELSNFNPIEGTLYPIVTGVGGNTNNNAHGTNTTFNTTSLVAQGGYTANRGNNTGNSGGLAVNSTGDVKRDGGTGATGTAGNFSGGGGSSAGNAANGRNGQGNVGGGNGTDSANLPAGAGAGGNGAKTGSAVGTAGVYPGGGGGGASRNNTTVRIGGNGAIGQVIITYTTPLLEKLRDNFDDNSLNAGKWLTAVSGTGTVTESSAQINIAPQSSLASAYAQIMAQDYYDLTSSYAVYEIKELLVANANCENNFSVRADGSNFIRFNIAEASRRLFAHKVVAGVYTEIGSNVAYDSSVHKWLRIRESGGTIYCDYSTDGVSWTNHGSVANPFVVTAVYPHFEAYANNVASCGTFKIDNFNVPAVIVTLDSPADTGTTSDTTPDLLFTGTDGAADPIRYNLQLATDNAFTVATITKGTVTGQRLTGGDPTSSITITDQNCIIAVVTTQDSNTNNLGAAGVSRDGQAFTKIFGYGGSGGAGQPTNIEIWYLLNPHVGTFDVVADCNGSINECTMTALPLKDVDTADLVNAYNGASANGSPADLTLTTDADGCYLIGGLVSEATISGVGGGQDSDASYTDQSFENTRVTSRLATTAGADSLTFSGESSAPYAWMIVAINKSPTGGSMVANVVSGTDAGFSGSPDNSDPFASAQQVTYTVQSALSLITYYWRVRGIAPAGGNYYGAWATTKSFTVISGVYVPKMGFVNHNNPGLV